MFITPRPRGGDWLDDDIAAFSRQGIGVLVSLLSEDEQIELGLEREATACATSSMQFVSMPVPDLGVPADVDEFIRVVGRLVQLIRLGRAVAVHCRQSVGRSGLLTVSVAIACGQSVEAAVEVVSGARGVRVPETKEQRDWLYRHAGRLSRAAA